MRITTLDVYLERQKSAQFIVEIIEGEWIHTDGQFAVNDSAARFAGTTHSVIILLLTHIVAETAIQYIQPSLPAPRPRYVPPVRLKELACLPDAIRFMVTVMLLRGLVVNTASCMTLFTVCGIVNIHDVSGVDSAPVFM
jgi:hypothetical protein